jgi:hypothetical protein
MESLALLFKALNVFALAAPVPEAAKEAASTDGGYKTPALERKSFVDRLLKPPFALGITAFISTLSLSYSNFLIKFTDFFFLITLTRPRESSLRSSLYGIKPGSIVSL